LHREKCRLSLMISECNKTDIYEKHAVEKGAR
jgi:hypothetical protein